MAKVLRRDVHVTDESDTVTILKAGEPVPKKFEKYVTNPKAFVGSDDAPVETDTKE